MGIVGVDEDAGRVVHSLFATYRIAPVAIAAAGEYLMQASCRIPDGHFDLNHDDGESRVRVTLDAAVEACTAERGSVHSQRRST